MPDLPTYPIPNPPPSEEVIAESLTLQAQRLRPVLEALATEITGSLADQQKAIDKVTAALKRRIRSGLRGQVQLLTPVMDAIHGVVAGSLAAQQVALATLMDAPVDPGCPPDRKAMIFPDGQVKCVLLSDVPAAIGAGAIYFIAGPPPAGTVPPPTPTPAPTPTPTPTPLPPEPPPATYPLPSDSVPWAPPGGLPGPQPPPPEPLPTGDVPQPAVPPAPPPVWPLLPLLPDWCSVTVCDTLDQVTNQVGVAGVYDSLASILYAAQQATSGGSGGWLSSLGWGGALNIVKGVSEFLKPAVNWVDKALAAGVVGQDCAPAPVVNVAVARALAGFVEQWAGVGLDPLLRKLDYWIGAYCPTIIPSASEANACFLAGTVDIDLWRCWVRANGVCDEPQRLLVEASRTRPDVDMEYRLWLRGAQGEQELLDRLRGLGVLHPEDELRFRTLQQQLPTPGELIQWVVRESFDLDVVKRWGYDAERPDVAAPFFQAQGLTGQYTRVGSISGQSDTVDHLAMTWASHWIPISPGQAYTMHHRIRPDNVAELQALGLKVQPFGLDAVQGWLKIADYPEGIRDYLIATAYQPLRLIDIRNALILGVRDKTWAYRQFLGRGHSPQDAQFSADLAEQQATNKNLAPVVALERKALTWLVQEVLDSYELGSVDRGSASQVLTEAGLSEAGAGAALDARDAKARRKLVQRAVNSVRRDYLAGAINLQEAAQALASAGIQPDQGNRYLELWSVELGHARRVVSTQKAIEWLSQGLITPEQAIQRLRNLGWSDPDIMTYLAEAQLKVSKQQAQARKAMQTSERQQAKELEKVQKAAQATADKAAARLAKLTPVNKLKTWYVSGYVTEPFVRSRMAAMGYTPESIELHVAEMRDAKEKADASANGKATGQP